MWGILVGRLLRTIPVFFLVTVGVFGLTALLPGDPAVTLAGDNPSPELVESIRARLGLDQPWYLQYLAWLGRLARGDLGTSLYSNEAVMTSIINRLPVTVSLAFVAILFAILIGLIGGIAASAKPGGWVDKATTVISTLGIAVPNFWLAMVLVIVFAFGLGWLPAVGFRPLSDGVGPWLGSIVLPAAALGAAAGAELLRQTRSSMIDTLGQDYIRTARAQGLPSRDVFWRRALKNASVPIVTTGGFQVAILLGGAVIIEKIFSLPGIGSLAIDAVFRTDLPIIQGVVLINAVIVLVVNFVVDIAYTMLNPKVRAS